MKEAELPVAQINLDLRNYRIGQQDSQQEAIKAIIADQEDGIVHLAEDILDIGLSPAELLIVMPDEEVPGFFTVLEGNRRITALKLMEVPTLAQETDVYRDFSKLAPKFSKKAIRKVRCVVVDTREEALPWIERRHSTGLDGRGQEPWRTKGRTNFEADRGRVRRHKAVLDLLAQAGKLDAATERALQNKTTTMDRVFNSTYIRTILGIQIERDGKVTFDNGNKAKGIALLQRVIKDMARPKWNVDDVRFDSQRENYIRQFSDGSVLAPQSRSTTTARPSTPPPTGAAPSGARPPAASATGWKSRSGTGPKRDTLTRKTLANTRKDLIFPVKNQRLNRLYIEGRSISVDKFTNSASFLMRAFLEMSVENYLLRNKISVPAKIAPKKWNDIGVTLADKVVAALADLDPTGRAKEWQNIRKALSDHTAHHSIQSMHAFVHNLQTDPAPNDLKRVWEAWETFLTTIHERTK